MISAVAHRVMEPQMGKGGEKEVGGGGGGAARNVCARAKREKGAVQ